ncbi:hypothetical protein DAETH_10780 [Deinococcus aetherius]|uniref:Uncharacterized protein n=1 Tax=Deinococcus aetherius TaxID=200252 RepID=A0ABM8ABJ5_9DEIO|nr:hypothetical protein DAETH_10780 [Deinococcus aetherius]
MQPPQDQVGGLAVGGGHRVVGPRLVFDREAPPQVRPQQLPRLQGETGGGVEFGEEGRGGHGRRIMLAGQE